jgi:hypothetical protein
MRQYIVVRAEKNLIDEYREFDPFRNFDPLGGWVFQILSDIKSSDDELRAAVLKLRDSVRVVDAPSTLPDAPDPQQELVVSLTFPDSDSIALLRKFVIPHLGESAPLRNIGADPAGHFCTTCPAAPARPFGNRSRVRNMMGIESLRAEKLTGYGVNVVIMDQGVNREAIVARNPASWGGGLGKRPAKSGAVAPERSATPLKPGSAPRNSHGTMMARNILDIAPKAKIYDVPLIPDRISRPEVFASTAHAAYQDVLNDINLRKKADAGSAWIFVNAWGIFDRTGEDPIGDYTLNGHERDSTGKVGHPLNKLMETAVGQGIDVVFAAGNCGQFTTSSRCGRRDRGEGRSIWGANAHPAVLTVGAVSANAEWLGYSSQGPAPWGGAQKPDICTPSHFCEDDDASKVNSGTSAATGLAAGVIAAIRGSAKWGPDKLSPGQLIDKINAAARGPNGEWNSRMGNGMLNARALLRELKKPAAA